ncbi:MAG TPA: aldolase/citrate lyase family protein [Propionibacteriaceae bacterium]|nr:aldolase/citrate lyase family protein [Propionibacteriaceae bacterium]
MSIKARLRAGERLLGVLLRMPSEDLLEMAAVSGFDFLVIDCEHGPADLTDLRCHLALADAHRTPVLVRVGSDEPALVLRALDQGAEGVIAPHVDDADAAAALVASAHYPPLGRRGFATYGRAGAFGAVDVEAHRRHSVETTLVLGMIESPTGVRNAAGIVGTPGLDGIMVGTADLRISTSENDPDPAESLAEVHRVLAAHQSIRMDIVSDRAQAEAAFAGGAALVTYNLTHTLMQHLAALRGAL